jgi:hypothetical protein
MTRQWKRRRNISKERKEMQNGKEKMKLMRETTVTRRRKWMKGKEKKDKNS